MLQSDLISSLQAWAAQHNLVEEALAACRQSLINCAAEDIEVDEPPLNGWPIDDLLLRFRRHALIFQHGLLSYPFVETSIAICIADTTGGYRNNERLIGSYRLILHLDGTVDDDYLELDDQS
jgi:hypothetical protein